MMARFPSENCASVTMRTAPPHPRQTSDAGRFEVLLLEAQFNPVQAHQVVDDLLHLTKRVIIVIVGMRDC